MAQEMPIRPFFSGVYDPVVLTSIGSLWNYEDESCLAMLPSNTLLAIKTNEPKVPEIISHVLKR
jgi:hypothetical protein